MTDKQLMKLALKKYCSPYGKANPETYAFIDGYKAALKPKRKSKDINDGFTEEDEAPVFGLKYIKRKI